MDELALLDATAQAELIRRGQAGPRELVEAAIARIERLDPQLNALVHERFEQALAEAAAAESADREARFHGVPFLLKDLAAEQAGSPIREGSAFVDVRSDVDQELVARHRRAGLIVLGRTNAPELGILPTTEPRAFGPTRNPWDTERTPGGSSGGSAAAVASGMVAMAHGNDGGGSIRIPASCCGIFGLKPTRGRNTLAPRYGDVYSGLVAEHALTRSVRDSAALLDATAGSAPGDPYVAPPLERPLAEEVGHDPGRLRIALTVEPLTNARVDPACATAVREAAALCEELGHEVVETRPAIDGSAVGWAFIRVWACGIAWSLAHWERRVGREATADDVEPLTWAMAEQGRQTSGADYLLAWEELHAASRRLAADSAHFDAWMTPVLAEPPLPLGSFEGPADQPLFAMARAGAFAPYTAVANITGQPAMSVPLHWTPEGLPIGTHFVGRFGDEATLIRLASQLEAAAPWDMRFPPVAQAA